LTRFLLITHTQHQTAVCLSVCMHTACSSQELLTAHYVTVLEPQYCNF